jgi:general stress protein YciG
MEEHTEGRNTPTESRSTARVPGAGNPGNFANNREKAVEAGRRGGQHSHGGGGATNNPGNFANNRQRAAEAGRKGGMQPRR